MTDDTMEIIVGRLEDVAEEGMAECKICGEEFQGDSFGEILEKLGRHGGENHPSQVKNEENENGN